MKDLLFNFVGAVVFCIIGYFYERSESKKGFARIFIIRRKESPESDDGAETSDSAGQGAEDSSCEKK